MLSINKLANKLAKKLIDNYEYYQVGVTKLRARAAEKSPSTNCKDYGKTSYEIYKAVDFDFTKIDPALFAPATISLTCAKTSTTFTHGNINYEIIKNSVEN